MHLCQAGELAKGRRVAQRHVDDAVVGQGGHGSDVGAFLTTSRTRGGDEDAAVFPPELAAGPLLSGGIPEGFPLRREVTITGGNADQERVVGLKNGRGDGGDV